MAPISQNLRRLEESVPEAEDDDTNENTELESSMNEDEEDEDEDEDDEDMDDEGEEDDDDEDDEDEDTDAVESGEVINDDFVLEMLEEELDEVEDLLSPEDLDELEQLLTTPEQEAESLQNTEVDDDKWDAHDDQVLPKVYEYPADDDALFGHDAIGSDDSLAPASDLKTVSIQKNGTYLLIFVALVFGIGLFTKFCGRKESKDRRRHITHKRLNMDDDFSA